MTTITNHVLRQQLKNITSGKSTTISNISTPNTTDNEENNTETNTQKIEIQTKKFQKITNYGDTITFTDNTKATILQPMPCMKWTPKKAPDKNGTVTLKQTLEATVLNIDGKQHILGYTGSLCGLCTELELLIDLGDTEILMNNEFYSIKAPTHVQDGVTKK